MNLSSTPASRNTDPASSRQQRLVRALVRRYPGRTSRELALVGNIDRYVVARRLPEIEPVHVRKGDLRRCEVGGRNAATWWPA